MDEDKSAAHSQVMMQRIRERLVEESQRLDEDVAQLAEEVGQLARNTQQLDTDVERLTQIAGQLDADAERLGGQIAAMNERLAALRGLVNDFLNTATLAKSVKYVHRAEQPEKVSER